MLIQYYIINTFIKVTFLLWTFLLVVNNGGDAEHHHTENEKFIFTSVLNITEPSHEILGQCLEIFLPVLPSGHYLSGAE